MKEEEQRYWRDEQMERKKGCTKYLMPKEIYKGVPVHDGKIEIAGHVYQCNELAGYDQQEIVVREFENELCLHEKTGKLIASINKKILNI